MRVGIGYDSHRFAEGRPLILAGITVPHTHGLTGHSDADPVAHAIIDAMLGAAAAGNIGEHFPDSDPAWRDADSMKLMAAAAKHIAERGYRVEQLDSTIITEQPRIGPHIEAMKARLATVLGIDRANVSVKAKTNEGMGFIGRGEGVAVLAVVTLEAR
ncbi:MAG TPA: 2-C-methyl-D-erythritol 2,4-cyclodiphosphate synthase [Gemmatimonadales bacterium]|nr:2-C-methyl-D-erythritol 2,4-cyclodiphosphate synthase [Gemmatimonadales bacterium]